MIDLHDTKGLIELKIDESVDKAIEALSEYKFWLFGYYAVRWVNYNHLLPKNERHKNPFKKFVDLALHLQSNPVEEV